MGVNALIFVESMGMDHTSGRAAGAYKIATEIRKAGYTCQVVDFFTKFSSDQMKKIISSFIGEDTLIVGFSSTFFTSVAGMAEGQTVAARYFSREKVTVNYPYSPETMTKWFDEMKQINPKIKIVLGGGKSIYLRAVGDAFAVGYCDQAIVEYMKYLEGKNPFFQFDKINDTQIAFYGSKYTDKFDFNESTIDWHETDFLQHTEAVPIEVSRGCIFKCKFCSYPLNGKKKLDYIKHNNVLRDEFLKNYYEHGITRYTYGDDTHNDSVEKVERLHKIVTSLPFELEYTAFLRHDLIHKHRHTAALLRESGVRASIFGIETLNHTAGKAIGKGLHPEKTKELLYWLKEDAWKDDVATTSGFIVGLPHDTPETIREWTKWLLDPECPLDSFMVHPLSIWKTGNIFTSEFADNSEKYGYTVTSEGKWYNKHFDSASAAALTFEIIDKGLKNERFGYGGFAMMMLTNLGFTAKELITRKRSKEFSNIINERTAVYVNGYKERLLNYCDQL